MRNLLERDELKKCTRPDSCDSQWHKDLGLSSITGTNWLVLLHYNTDRCNKQPEIVRPCLYRSVFSSDRNDKHKLKYLTKEATSKQCDNCVCTIIDIQLAEPAGTSDS